jgi:hypothetical protein
MKLDREVRPKSKDIADAVLFNTLKAIRRRVHIRRSQPTRAAAPKDARAQLLQNHAVNRIVGP